ncbi:MAG: hypothetical protein RL708_1028 [Bacteroidota bacterium]|jgi:hypothetical protein
MEGNGVFILLLYLILRIVGVSICATKAKELNRDYGSWGVFSFFLPIIAMIWIQFMPPLTKWDKETANEVNKSDTTFDS